MIPEFVKAKWKINEGNFLTHFLRFGDRQAGVSLVFDGETATFAYNTYCLEAKLIQELFAVEHLFLEQALETLDAEFGGWELVGFEPEEEGCGSCSAKA